MLNLLLIIIGFLCHSVNLDASETLLRSSESIDKKLLVIIEPKKIIPISQAGKYMMIPYKKRRANWGFIAGLSHGTYTPENYKPNFSDKSFMETYGNQSLTEIHLNIKRNLDWGALGVSLGIGIYREDNNATTLSLTPLRLGGQYTMDHLFSEPFVVPYISGGLYTVFYEEKLEAKAFKGNTRVSPYGSAGMLFQLDWVDTKAAVESYLESNIENTFLFLEARYFMASQNEENPNLSTLHTTLGLKVEF